MEARAIKGVGGEFCRFFVVGVGATLIHLLVYWLVNALFGIGDSQQMALSLSYATGYAVSFIANYLLSIKWTFRTQGSVGKGVGFAFAHLVNAGMHLLLLNLFACLGVGRALVALLRWICPWLVEWIPLLEQPESLLPFPVYALVVPINFLMVRYFLKR